MSGRGWRLALLSALPVLGALAAFWTTGASSSSGPNPDASLVVRPAPSSVAGQVVLLIDADVRNTTDEVMQSQGPDAGYVYPQGQSFLSPAFTPRAGSWRVAVGPDGLSPAQLPYRWGFGGPLPPGGVRHISGGITLSASAVPAALTAALVQETQRVDHLAWRWSLIGSHFRQAQVVVDVATLRAAPSASAAVVGEARYATSLSVLDAAGQWLKVRVPGGAVGWLPAACAAQED